MLLSNYIRVAGWIAGVLLLAWLIIRGVYPGWNVPHSDFNNYYVSARLVANGSGLDSLYNNEWFQNEIAKAGVNTPGKFAPFPPITAWVMLPLAGLDSLAAQRVLVVVNLVFLIICALGWARVTGWSVEASLLVVVAGGASVINNVAFGQVYLIMTTFLLWSIVWMRNDMNILAGATIGVLTVVKYFPFAMIAGLLMTAMGPRPHTWWEPVRRVVPWWSATVILLVLAQFAFFGPFVMREYFTSAFLPHLASELTGQGMYSFPFQSWDSLSRNLFVYHPEYNPQPWINWPSGRPVLKICVLSIVGILSVAAMYRARSFVYRAGINMGILCLAALVVSPASATYHFVLLLLPLGLLIGYGAMSRSVTAIAVALYVMMGFIPYGWFVSIARESGLVFAYPRLWIITLIFLIVTAGIINNPHGSPRWNRW